MNTGDWTMRWQFLDTPVRDDRPVTLSSAAGNMIEVWVCTHTQVVVVAGAGNRGDWGIECCEPATWLQGSRGAPGGVFEVWIGRLGGNRRGRGKLTMILRQFLESLTAVAPT